MHEDGQGGGFHRCQCINLTYISLSASLCLAVCLTPQRLARSDVMKETSVMGCQVLKASLEATGRDVQTPTNSVELRPRGAVSLCSCWHLISLPTSRRFIIIQKPNAGRFLVNVYRKMEETLYVCVALYWCAGWYPGSLCQADVRWSGTSEKQGLTRDWPLLDGISDETKMFL